MNVNQEDGFTLLEVLIAMFIMTIVFAVVSVAIIVGLQSTGESTTRLLESSDGAYTSAYLVRDVQSAQTVSTSASSVCSSTGTSVLKLSWTEALNSGAVSTTVEYRYGVPGGALVRHVCQDNPSTRTVATQLRQAPTITLTPTGCTTACTAVTMQLTGVVDGSFSISATRRAS